MCQLLRTNTNLDLRMVFPSACLEEILFTSVAYLILPY
jgi:hypothetical protein